MLRELKEIGDYEKEAEGEEGIDALLDDFGGEKALCIDIQIEDGTARFGGVSVIDVGSAVLKEKDLLYAKKHSNIPHHTPTGEILRIYDFDKYKRAQESSELKTSDTLSLRITDWFERQDDEFADKIRELFEDQEEEIRDRLAEAYNSLSEGDHILTIRVSQDGESFEPIGEIDYFREKALEGMRDRLESKHDTESSSDSACALCGEDTRVYGFSFPFKFYTLDNKRYAPNFSQKESWKNIPLCEECSFSIKRGQEFLEQNTFDFLGDIDYYILPSFPFGDVKNDVMEAFKETDTEQELTFLVAERLYAFREPDYPVSLTFIFHDSPNQGSQRIRRYIEDVSPSHIWQAKEALIQESDKLNEYRANGLSDNSVRIQDIIFTVLPGYKQRDSANDETPDSENPQDKQAFFDQALDIMAHILKDDPIKYRRLMSMFGAEAFNRMQRQMAKGDSDDRTYYRQYTVRTFMFLNFLDELGLLAGRGETTMDDYEQIIERWNDEPDKTLEQFFDDFDVAFDTPDKRAMFLLGVLSKHLMNAQYKMAEGGNPPFEKKLANLRLTRDKVENFYTTLFQDIDHYDAKSDLPIGYPRLRQSASTYLVEADQNGWSIENEELRYYFTLGMSVNQIFKTHGENYND